ncbi:MAG: 50S ribosomal protein L23 [Alphaproteobacteria bacterium]|nr:50S ribosomal protein L23 [Alphaproteobacteria bacterium]
MELKDTLVRPIITEKSTTFLGNDRTYAFEVGLSANKRAVKRAIESFYGVEVESVRTLVVRGKMKRFGRHYGKRSNWKKAYVTLAEGHSINIYE